MKQSKLNRKYKLLLLDIDGTLVPYDYTALPSENVKKAIKSIVPDINNKSKN